MKEEKHMFVIPTHRRCAKAVDSILLEMEIASSYGLNCFLVVVDNSAKDIYLENDEYLSRVSKEVQYDIYHIGDEFLESFISDFAKEKKKCAKEIRDLLIPIKVDYGKVHNWIYICSIILKAEYIHRRDSDCYVTGIDKDQYPVIDEIKYLGKNINSVLTDLNISKMDTFSDVEKVCIAGSDYSGNWNLDIHELKEIDADVVKKLLSLSNIPDEQIEQIIENDYASVEYKKDETPAVLKNTFDFPYNTMPECGNISMYSSYRYIPNFIGEYGIGYDYFSYFMCFLFKVPIVFHKKRIMHIHDEKRYTDIAFLDYWRGMYKNIMLDCLYSYLIDTHCIDELLISSKGIEAISVNYMHLPEIIKKCIAYINEEDSKRILHSICNDILINTNLEKYKEIGYKLISMEEQLFSEVKNDFTRSVELMMLWKEIVDYSSIYSYRNVICPLE